jgi:hypothetical protein
MHAKTSLDCRLAPARAWLALGVWLCTALFAPAGAAAQTRDPIVAEALFEAGRQFYQAGDYASARGKFAEAARLDPTAGALSNLAACEEKLGLTASAWQSWRAALEYVPPAEKVRRASIAAKISALEPVLARLVLRMPSTYPPGTEVRRDGVVLGSAAIGIALPVDPGDHEVIVSAPGHDTRRFTFNIAASDRKSITLAVGPVVAAPAIQPRPPAPQTRADERPDQAPLPSALREKAAPAKTGPSALGITLLAASAAALGGAGYTGMMARNARQDAGAGCQMNSSQRLCMTGVKDALDRDKRFSLYTDIALGTGVALAGAGIFLLLSGSDSTDKTPDETRAALLPRPGGGTLEVGGRF